MNITITQDKDAWRQLLSILAEITHGSCSDQRLIDDFSTKVEKELCRVQKLEALFASPSLEKANLTAYELCELVLEVVKAAEGLSITEIEDQLRTKDVKFRRDDLRSAVWRLAAAQLVQITPQSQIKATVKTDDS